MDGLVVGRIVYFVVDKDTENAVAHQRVGTGGNPLHAGDIVPAMVVRVWDVNLGYVNLKLLLDGPDTYWATSVTYAPIIEHPMPRSWHWMYDGQATRGQGATPNA